MHLASRLALSSMALVSIFAASCGGSRCLSASDTASERPARASAGNPSYSGPSEEAPAAVAPGPGVDASRAVNEADIVQLDAERDRLYAISRSGSLAVVDTSQPGRLALLGKVGLSGEPFEMYQRGDILLTMSNHGVGADGNILPAAVEGTAARPGSNDPKTSALISAVDVSNPAQIQTIASFKVAGEIADSRIVGHVLYLATYENAQCYGCATTARTIVTTFDIANPRAPQQVDQVTFVGPPSGPFNAAWSTPWKRSIASTSERLYVGGLAAQEGTTTDEGIIEVLDITDPSGKLVRGATIATSGPVMSRWQMDESEGVLRVISQRGAGRTANGEKYPDIDTFRIESASSMPRIGHSTLTLPRQEGLKTVRFDGKRAYAITFNQTDPLFTIDLSDPTRPLQKGELHMPGWVYHLEPRGDRLIGLGLDRTDSSGNLNVTLFDVSDMSNPTLTQRISFGPSNMYEDYMITNGVLAEDQDRIQKAFRVFDDGLVTVPFSGSSVTGNGCTGGGVQLLEWTTSSLTKRALLPVSGNPRRAIRRERPEMKELIAVSDSIVSSFRIDALDQTNHNSDVTIGTCTPRSTYPGGGGGWERGHGVIHGDDSMSRGRWSGSTCE